MTVIAAVPFTMKNCSVKFGATNEYQTAISKVTLTPSADSVTFKAVAPGAVYSDIANADWTCDMEFAQDFATANSLSSYLHANEGSTVGLTFDPIAGGATITVNVVVTPGAIGGDVGAFALATVSLPCVGKPAIGA